MSIKNSSWTCPDCKAVIVATDGNTKVAVKREFKPKVCMTCSAYLRKLQTRR